MRGPVEKGGRKEQLNTRTRLLYRAIKDPVPSFSATFFNKTKSIFSYV